MSDNNTVFEIRDGVNLISIQTATPDDHPDSSTIISCTLLLSGGAFRGQYPIHILVSELKILETGLQMLHKDLTGSLVFFSLDHSLTLTIEGDGYGHFGTDCTATDHPALGATLKFRLSFDQSYIPAMINQLNAFTRLFPADDHSTQDTPAG